MVYVTDTCIDTIFLNSYMSFKVFIHYGMYCWYIDTRFHGTCNVSACLYISNSFQFIMRHRCVCKYLPFVSIIELKNVDQCGLGLWPLNRIQIALKLNQRYRSIHILKHACSDRMRPLYTLKHIVVMHTLLQVIASSLFHFLYDPKDTNNVM